MNTYYQMLDYKSYSKKVVYILIIFELLRTRFFNCMAINPAIVRYVWTLVVSYFILVSINTYSSIRLSGKAPNRWIIVVLGLSLVGSAIGADLNSGQDFFLTFKWTLSSLGILIYFYLHKYEVQEKSIIKAVTYICLILFFIQVIQQFLPDKAIFGVRIFEDMSIEDSMLEQMRNGLYRYDFGASTSFIQLILFYYWCSVNQKYTRKDLVLLAIFFASIYLTLTRQTMFSVFVGICMSIPYCGVRLKGKMRWVGIIGLILVSVSFADALFGFLVESAKSDLDNDSYIRLESAAYFFSNSISSPAVAILGNGMPCGDSTYDVATKQLALLGLYASDVGIIGDAYKYGWIHALTALFAMLLIVIRYKNKVPSYLVLFAIASLTTSVMMFQSGFVLAIVLYLCDIHLTNSPQCIQQYE